MLRPISTEGFIFWWFNWMVGLLVLCWMVKNICEFLEHRDKLRKKIEFLGLSALGITYLYCMFSYVRSLG